jgi:signal transduction histidine kinase
MDQVITTEIERIARLTAVPSILEIVSEMTGLRFAAVARVTGNSWTACAVLDKIDFGLKAGGQLDVATTLCREIHASRQPIIIEKASADRHYCGHPTPKMYGFESYIAVPIVRRSGEVFGTICALDPLPALLKDPKILKMIELYAELIASQLEIEDRLVESQSALAIAAETGALREQFIAVLGHDLRNPLFSLIAGIKGLLRRPLDDKAKGIVAQMEQSCTRMSNLVDDILDFARARLGGGIAVERRFVDDLGVELDRIVDELRVTDPSRVIEADIAIEGPVHCDPQRLAQLFSNLLGNALSHGAADKPIRVVGRGTKAAFELSVTNDGPPIAPETMAQMFKPFSRPAKDAPQAGLGLGLYIASQIARSHGGSISVHSTQAAGTTFTFTFAPTPDDPPTVPLLP